MSIHALQEIVYWNECFMFYLLHFHDRFMTPATLKVSQAHVTEVVATYIELYNNVLLGVWEPSCVLCPWTTALQGLSQFLCRTYGRTGDWQSDAALWWEVWRYNGMTLGRMTLVTTPCNRCLILYVSYQASNIIDHLSWKLMPLVTSGRLCYYSGLDSLSSQNQTHIQVRFCSKSSCGAK